MMELFQINFNYFVEFDDNIAVFSENIVELKTETETIDLPQELNSDSDECEEMDIEEPVRLNDAIIAINRIRKYITQCNGCENSFELINKLENDIYKNRTNALKQSKITDYMSIL